MMAPNPDDRLTWEQVLENEWLRMMTEDFPWGQSLNNVDLEESSDYIEM